MEIRSRVCKYFLVVMERSALHIPIRKMKIVEIEIPEETVNLEKGRPPEAMRYDDFIWCIGVVFSFLARSLVIDASLFGFMKKLLEAMKDVRNTGQSVLLNDENGAYQINLSQEGERICLHDTFGNGSVSIPFEQLLEGTNAEFLRATKELEDKIPPFLGNWNYRKVKNEIEESIQALTA